jgi:hypothetical protein
MASHAVKLAPSILAADFARLGEQVVEAERYGADRLHVDVMDGPSLPTFFRCSKPATFSSTAAIPMMWTIFVTLAPGIGDIPLPPKRPKKKGTAENGYLHCGPNGAGHFVKPGQAAFGDALPIRQPQGEDRKVVGD